MTPTQICNALRALKPLDQRDIYAAADRNCDMIEGLGLLAEICDENCGYVWSDRSKTHTLADVLCEMVTCCDSDSEERNWKSAQILKWFEGQII